MNDRMHGYDPEPPPPPISRIYSDYAQVRVDATSYRTNGGENEQHPPEAATEAPAGEQQQPRKSQATLLVDIAVGAGFELCHTPEGEAYATVDVGAHRETHPMRSKAFKRLLAQRFYVR